MTKNLLRVLDSTLERSLNHIRNIIKIVDREIYFYKSQSIIDLINRFRGFEFSFCQRRFCFAVFNHDKSEAHGTQAKGLDLKSLYLMERQNTNSLVGLFFLNTVLLVDNKIKNLLTVCPCIAAICAAFGK